MNKQLINKYKPEFDHWLNEGSILARVITSDEDDFMYTIWYVVDSNDLEKWKAEYLFNLTNTQIEYYKPQFIINDEYVEFRKALAEGKTIEYLGQSSNLWQELKDANFNLHQTCYRIKPDEPKFKVGDFVKVTPKSHRAITNSGPTEFIGIIKHIDKYTLYNVKGINDTDWFEFDDIQLWTPIKDEWCWFYDRGCNKYAYVAKFKEMNKQYFISNTGTYWQFCEPFLNSLPSYLKDK